MLRKLCGETWKLYGTLKGILSFNLESMGNISCVVPGGWGPEGVGGLLSSGDEGSPPPSSITSSIKVGAGSGPDTSISSSGGGVC